MRTAALICLVVLAGCVSPQPFTGPNGRQAYSMACGSALETCYRKAGALCPTGYQIIDLASATAIIPAGSTIIGAPQHSLAIECK